MQIVAEFDDFNELNDAHGERALGSFELGGVTCVWQIDHFDKRYCALSDDPSDVSKTNRVMTVCLKHE